MDESGIINTIKTKHQEKDTGFDQFSATQDREVDVEQRVYRKLREFEREAFIDHVQRPEEKNNAEEGPRRKKKLGSNEQSCFRKVVQEDLEQDIAQLRKIVEVSGIRVKIENKQLKTKNGTFKKNDRVKISFNSNSENVVISWINSNEITFRRHDGTKLKCSTQDISDGTLKIYRL